MHPADCTHLVHLSFPQEVYCQLEDENRECIEDAAVGPILVSRGRVTFSVDPKNLWDITAPLDDLALRMWRQRVRLDAAQPIPVFQFHHAPHHPRFGKGA